MKKLNILKAFFVVLAITFVFASGSVSAASRKAQTLKIDNNTRGMTSAEAKVYKKLKAQMKKLPEGTAWTNEDAYAFRGGYFSIGYGCSAFVFKMSDLAFGNRPGTMHFNFDKIKVGDIIRMDNNTHSVIVMKVVGNTLVTAEGNYGGTVHWGRLITRSEVEKTGTYIITRY